MRILNLLMAAVFVFGAIVQINDPDPIPWIAIYLVAAGVCVLASRRTPALWQPAAVALISLVWALTIELQEGGRAPFLDLFAEWEMRDVAVEETRETYGLIIIGVWMLVVAAQVLKARRGIEPNRPSDSISATRTP